MVYQNWRENAPTKKDPPELCAKMIAKNVNNPEYDGMWANCHCVTTNNLAACKQKALSGTSISPILPLTIVFCG